MSLKERITEDMKASMRSGDKERLAGIRLMLAAIKQREVDERIQLDDTQVLAVLEKMIKQRRESITQFEAGGRADLVAKESAELSVLQAYLPAQLADAEVESLTEKGLAFFFVQRPWMPSALRFSRASRLSVGHTSKADARDAQSRFPKLHVLHFSSKVRIAQVHQAHGPCLRLFNV